MRKAFLTLLLILVCSPSWATEQVVIGGSDDNLSNSATEYNDVFGGGGSWSTTEADANLVISSPATFKSLKIELESTPGAGKSYAFTLRKNGSDTSVTCTVSDTNTTCSDASNSFTVVAGDLVALQSVPSGTPSAIPAFWSMIIDTTTDGESIYGQAITDDLSASATEYAPVFSSYFLNTNDNIDRALIPTSGTIKNLTVKLQAAPGAGKSYQFTLRKNRSNQITTCTVADAATTCTDTSNTYTVAAGDTVAVQIVPSGTPDVTRASIGITFLSDTVGEFIVNAVSRGGFSNSASSYQYVIANDTINSSTESQRVSLAQSMTLKNIYVALDDAPGAGKSLEFVFNEVGVAETALKCTISDTNSTCNDTTDITLSDGGKYNLKANPSGTPSVGEWRLAMLGYISPTSTTPIIQGATIYGATIQQ